MFPICDEERFTGNGFSVYYLRCGGAAALEEADL